MKKVAIITGAGRGIGKSIAHRLAKDGFDIVVNDIELTGIEKVAEEIKELGADALAFAGDVSKKEQVTEMVEKAVKKFGKLDVMIANAGISMAKPVVEMSVEEWDRIFSINCRGVFLCDQAAAKQMIKQNYGKIINCSSIAGVSGTTKLLAAYSATKFAVRGFTQVLARELGEYKITVNSYCPGVIDTEMWDMLDETMCNYMDFSEKKAFDFYSEGIVLKRSGRPEDVAAAVSFLASPDADYITGQTLVIDGGIVTT